MAILANPAAALVALDAASLLPGARPPGASDAIKSPGEDCFPDKKKEPCQVSGVVIHDGKRCEIVADCTCECVGGTLVATRCGSTTANCEPIEDKLAIVEPELPT